MERTLSIIKPDSVAKANMGAIISIFEKAGLKIAAMKMMHLSRKQAEGFYFVHKSRPFFGELVDFMISGPVVVMVLEGENAIARNRELMGATDPKNAAAGTIRALYGESVGINAVHGSDSPENALIEVAYFFASTEIVNAS
ncbi:nucleoside-diphosphate kinase [Chlamydiifrater phoenicopteri]|uniref:nucleoside-diphosphate kinase n=1 Tax=Chlamydiifrater phoenicopteri TaxID=2681469 RepID=UPI001BD01A9E|nr:nucleoside-diphosphate kinase [Chlamydiifrater phoenicopteri]